MDSVGCQLGYLPFDYDDNIDVGNLQLSYLHDSLDSLYFATSGALHNLTFREPVRRVAFSADGRRVALSLEDGTVRVWGVTGGQ